MPLLATHTHRATGKKSSPDITIVHAQQAERYEWKVLDKLGSSDHNPILITREAEGLSKVNLKYAYRWDLKNAKYEEFREQVEETLPERYEEKSLHKLEKILRKKITEAAEKHIGKKAYKRDAVPGLTKEVKKEIEVRNQLKKKSKEEGGRRKWIDKCKEVNEMIRKEKAESWKEYVDGLDTKTNCKQVWKTIRNLDGRVSQRKDNEVLVVEGKGYVNDKDKAREFAKTYKKVSRIGIGPKDRETKRANRAYMNSRHETESEYEEELTWSELEGAIKEVKPNKAPGEDTIPHDLIKELGPKARKFILHMYNRVWKGEEIPQRWRQGHTDQSR